MTKRLVIPHFLISIYLAHFCLKILILLPASPAVSICQPLAEKMLDWPLFAHRRAGFHLLLLQALLLLGQLRIWAGMADGAYLKSRCGFQSQNYTIKWAYEPQTQNVVFVLKAKLPIGQQAAGDKEEATEKRLLTGIAFGSETEMDFVGIAFSAINDQLDLVSGRANAGDSLRLSTVPRDGQHQPKGNNNSLTGPAMATVRGISLKRRPQDGSVIAEFARPLSGERPAARADLSGCTTFFLLTQWMAFDPTTKEKSELPISTAIRRQVCALTEKCSLDVREIHGQPPSAGEDKPAEAVQQQRHRDELVHGGTEDVAQSVDVSGKGDPCSFVGADYAVQWSYNKAKDAVEFVMRLKAKKGRWWSAVGIGDNMSDMDIGVVFVENGQPKEMVDYFSSSYDVPDRDSSQDWKLDKAERRGGVEGEEVELHFWRRLITDDAEKDRSLDGCVLFQFAANGGNYGPGNRIHKHHDWPDLYKACDLKKRCIRQKRQSSKEEDGNLPEISHSTDNKEAESNSKAGGKEAPGSGDKVISLLMKSLGPQIVQTVSESEADANYRNASAETGTVFPILGDDSTANYTAGPTSVNGKQDVENPNPVLALKPPANKRQEPLGGETTALTTETTTSALPAEEQTYSTAVATPPTAVSSNTGSPFSLNAFLGGNGGGEPPPAPVGEPAVTASSTPTTASSSTAVLRISGEATSAEARGGGGGEASTQQGGGGDDAGFGINQLFGEGSSTAAANGADEGVEQGRTVSTGNDTSATLGTQATTAAASGQIGGQLGSLPPVGEPAHAQAPGGEVGGGHPAEEAEAAANNTTVAAIPPSTAAATEQGMAITEPYEEQSSQQQPAATTPQQQQPSAAEQTTYAVPERPSSVASSTVSSSPTASAGPTSSTGGFELIASPTQNGGETTGTETDEPTSSRRPPEEASTPTPTTLATTIASSSSSSSASSPTAPPATAAGTSASTKAESEEELQGRGEDEDLIYSTPAPQSPPPPSPAPQPRASSQNPNTVLEESSSTGAGAMELEEPAAGNGTTAGGSGQTSGPEREQPQVPAGHGGASTSASGELEERGIKLPVATSKCDALRPDLPICQSYMGAYMERVKDWAERHGQPVENQFPKACKLLSAVPHVPTLCCQHFADKCADYV